jgi:ATP-dependent Lon protease
MEIKTAVFATSNNLGKIITPLQSRFFIIRLEPYTYEQFYDITVRLLTTSNQHNVGEEIVRANSVWKTSRSIRDSIKIAKMAKTLEDVWYRLYRIVT